MMERYLAMLFLVILGGCLRADITAELKTAASSGGTVNPIPTTPGNYTLTSFVAGQIDGASHLDGIVPNVRFSNTRLLYYDAGLNQIIFSDGARLKTYHLLTQETTTILGNTAGDQDGTLTSIPAASIGNV